MSTNNIIDFEAKKRELYEKKRAEQVGLIESKEDFVRGELFVVDGLIASLELQKEHKAIDINSLLDSLYEARKELLKVFEDNKGPEPVS